MQKLIPWVGGKNWLTKKILALIPDHNAYVEVFLGGGSVFFAKEPSKVEIINDLDGRLVTLFRVVQRHPEEFLGQLHQIIYSRKNLEDFCAQTGPPDIERAAYGAILNRKPSYTISTKRKPPRISAQQISDFIEQVYERLQRVYIEQQDFEKLLTLRDSKQTFFYLDPPYYGFEDCYESTFSKKDHERLAHTLKNVKGKWLLSYNNNPQIRAFYKSYKTKEVSVNYSISNSSSKHKKTTELLIMNY